MSETAKVEVLTAEVRALMVGNRQITLSVFRQLDWVNISEIKIFGRVNDEKTLNEFRGHPLLVVGANNKGILCRSAVYCPRKDIFLTVKENGTFDDSVPINAEKSFHVYNGETFNAYINDLRKDIFPEDLEKIIKRELDLQASLFFKKATIYDRAKNAPLIILAGLK